MAFMLFISDSAAAVAQRVLTDLSYVVRVSSSGARLLNDGFLLQKWPIALTAAALTLADVSFSNNASTKLKD